MSESWKSSDAIRFGFNLGRFVEHELAAGNETERNRALLDLLLAIADGKVSPCDQGESETADVREAFRKNFPELYAQSREAFRETARVVLEDLLDAIESAPDGGNN